MARKKEPEEPLALERQDWITEQIQKELVDVLDANGKPLPNTEKHILRAIAQMAAFTLPISKIANNIGMPHGRVKAILKAVSMQREISRLQDELYGADAQRMFKRMIPKVAEKLYDLVDNADKDSAKIEAGKAILDRALGKPTQTIEQTTTLIKDVLTRLNNSNQPISEGVIVPQAVDSKVEKTKGATPDQPRDPLEDLLAPQESSQPS